MEGWGAGIRSVSLSSIKMRVVVDALLAMESEAFSGHVFRVTLAGIDPLEGSADGRWSAGPDVAVLYTSVSADGAVAEVVERLRHDDALAASRKHMLHELSVTGRRILRLTGASRLARLGIAPQALTGDDYEDTNRLAEAAYRTGLEGLLVPSAVDRAENLVLFRDRLPPPDLFAVASTRLSPIDLREKRLNAAVEG